MSNENNLKNDNRLLVKDVIELMLALPQLSPVNYFKVNKDNVSSQLIFDRSNEVDAGLIRLSGKDEIMVSATIVMERLLRISPQAATELALAQLIRKIYCFGAEVSAYDIVITNVNMSSPYHMEMVDGIKEGCSRISRKFNIPMSHQKTLFTCDPQTLDQMPSLVLNGLGVLSKEDDFVTSRFKTKGNNIYLLGNSIEDTQGSLFQKYVLQEKWDSLMRFDLDVEIKLKKVLEGLVSNKMIETANPMHRGGLFFSLLRAGYESGFGFDITTDMAVTPEAFLFGEYLGRVIVSVSPDKDDAFVDYMTSINQPFCTLGHVTKGEIRIDDQSYGYIDKDYSEVEQK
ncbi:AIR synthase-related protein [Prolixibacteraceae bacterium]|nr:AIR synthase-related protein [Prolixibacteraceae bacterium]